jgi:hypothetical protein
VRWGLWSAAVQAAQILSVLPISDDGYVTCENLSRLGFTHAELTRLFVPAASLLGGTRVTASPR